jgi:hypothetical protein
MPIFGDAFLGNFNRCSVTAFCRNTSVDAVLKRKSWVVLCVMWVFYPSLHLLNLVKFLVQANFTHMKKTADFQNRRRELCILTAAIFVTPTFAGTEKSKMSTEPKWMVPRNISDLVATNKDQIWEDESWKPILLTVMGGTVYRKRPIPLAWQIEFDPSDIFFARANARLRQLGIEPDGYGWADVIKSQFEKYHLAASNEAHYGDTELDTCVIWVESEKACRLLMRTVWKLINRS